ncbi:hypothetical protein [Kingella negevensis]|uniref:hypothetical protein n=1 Tax=Kingella negevensis TaxID=1522312 RepID=UPI00050A28D8|nr:hypothetical protein [Kingella negevensis]MDK4689225.1 hypothetical protein [Kingella negevensis]WII91420.1 hypothetical protein QEO93_02220 [Kingella negevensis]
MFKKLLLLTLLAACSPSETTQQTAASAPKTASESTAIANDIIASASQEDILSARKEAKNAVTASDVTAAAQTQFPIDTASAPFPAASEANLPPLNPICEQYYHRADACFAKQGEDADTLRAQNQEARLEVMRESPDEAACQALNRSFDAVAYQLRCE